MSAIDAGTDELTALEEGRAFVELTSFRKVFVSGADAGSWLHDLVTADVAGLDEGRAARSLLLSPTGRIRADLHVARVAEGYLLFQDDRQPSSIADQLSPYVLSSSVHLRTLGADRVLIAALGEAADRAPRGHTRPSVVGPGADVLIEAPRASELRATLQRAGVREVSAPAVATWRVRLGIATFGVDFDEGSLPSEAGLESAIDFTKGCFLGQESVAKVRNLGHPQRVLLRFETDRRVAPGAPILADGERAGEVTSAAPLASGDGSALIGWVRWDAEHANLQTGEGVGLMRIQPGD